MQTIPLPTLFEHASTLAKCVAAICQWRNQTIEHWAGDHFDVYLRTTNGLLCCSRDDVHYGNADRIWGSRCVADWADTYIFDFRQSTFDCGVWIARDCDCASIQSTADTADTFQFWLALSLRDAGIQMSSCGLYPETAKTGVFKSEVRAIMSRK